MTVAVGCSVGTGWVVMVSVQVSAHGATGRVPEVVDRRWVGLASPGESHLYHLAKGLDLPAAEPFVAGVAKRADDAAIEAVGELRRTLGLQAGGALPAVVVGPEPPWDWPSLHDIVRSHTLIHTAEGHLLREAVWDALVDGGGAVQGIPKKNVAGTVAAALGWSPTALQRTVTDMGRPLGKPWRREQKDAALAAWWRTTL